MKLIFASLLFICVAGTSSATLFTLPKHNLAKLEKASKDFNHITKLTSFGAKSLLGHLFKQGQNERKRGQPMNDTSAVVKLMVELLFDLKDLKAKRDALGKSFAKEFATSLLEKPRNAIKVTFGSHIRKLHLDCNQHMIEFAKDARESGIFEHVDRDDLDFTAIMGGVIQRGEEGGHFLAEYFAAIDKHGLYGDQVVKIITTIGSLYADAACDLELDGYLGSIGKELSPAQNKSRRDHGHLVGFCPKKSFQETVMKVATFCKATKDILNNNEVSSPILKAMSLLYEDGCGCEEEEFVAEITELTRAVVDLFVEGYKLFATAHGKSAGLFREMMSHYAQNQTDKGDLLLAKFVLGGLRTATLVGNALFSCPAGACPKEVSGKSGQGNNENSGKDLIEQKNEKMAGEGEEQSSQESDQESDQQNVHQGHQQELLTSGKARKLFRPHKPRLLKNNVKKST